MREIKSKKLMEIKEGEKERDGSINEELRGGWAPEEENRRNVEVR